MSTPSQQPPRDFDGLRTLILTQHDSLPKRLAQVARFAVENPEDIALGTAMSIARAADVQPSTLVRFAHAFGYQGFSDFQDVFRQQLKARSTPYEDRLAHARANLPERGSAHIIANGMFGAAFESLDRVLHKIDPEALEEAVTLLAGADTLYLLAQRRSYPVTAYLGYICGKLKMRSVTVGSAQGNEDGVLHLAGRNDVALSISFSPYASATVDWSRVLHDQKVPIVGITDSPFSPIARMAQVWLEVAEADFEGFRSLSATMALSVSLVIAAANKRRGRIDD